MTRRGERGAGEALAHAGGIQCLLMDVELPDGEGCEAASRILSGRDGIPVLYVSGSPEALLPEHGVSDPAAPFLAKPYAPIDLARGVRTLIDGAQARGSTASSPA